MEEENLTVEQVAEILKVSKATVWTKCKQKRIPAFRMPGSRRWLIPKQEFMKWQKNLLKNQYDNR